MIYEWRTYTLKPGAVPEVERLFAEALPGRNEFSRLGGFFHTDIGPLNQIIHVWPYDDLAHIDRVRLETEANRGGGWPPPITDYVVHMQVDLLRPAPFMNDWTGPQQLGELYELRTYDLAPGSRNAVIDAWAERIDGRVKISPLAGCWTSGAGGAQNRLYHLWAYRDFEHRESARAESHVSGRWPPDSGQHYIRQENEILVPAAFSPMH